MTHPIDIRTIAGCAAVAATLLLSSPGVRAERSGEISEAGPTCGSPQVADSTAGLEAFLAGVRREQASLDISQDTGYVVLNNAGYNYTTHLDAARPDSEAKANGER